MINIVHLIRLWGISSRLCWFFYNCHYFWVLCSQTTEGGWRLFLKIECGVPQVTWRPERLSPPRSGMRSRQIFSSSARYTDLTQLCALEWPIIDIYERQVGPDTIPPQASIWLFGKQFDEALVEWCLIEDLTHFFQRTPRYTTQYLC